MAPNQIKLAAPAVLFSGNVGVEVPAGTVLSVPSAGSTDELAEALAQNTKLYGENRDQLTHEIVERHKVKLEGAEWRLAAAGDLLEVRVKVSYGPHGARVEEVVGPVEAEPAQPDGEGSGDGENGSSESGNN